MPPAPTVVLFVFFCFDFAVDVPEMTSLVAHELRRAGHLLPALEGYVADLIGESPTKNRGGGEAVGCLRFVVSDAGAKDSTPAAAAAAAGAGGGDGARKKRKTKVPAIALADDLM